MEQQREKNQGGKKGGDETFTFFKKRFLQLCREKKGNYKEPRLLKRKRNVAEKGGLVKGGGGKAAASKWFSWRQVFRQRFFGREANLWGKVVTNIMQGIETTNPQSQISGGGKKLRKTCSCGYCHLN